MRVLRSVSIFCASVTLFITTAALTLASDAAVRDSLGSTASASGFKNICGGSACVATIVGASIKILLGLMGVALIGYVLYAGFLWMTAGGEEKQVESALTTIRNAVIGIVIMGASYTMASVGIKLVERTFTSVPAAPLTENRVVAPTPRNAPAQAFPIDPFRGGCQQSACTRECIAQEDCAGARGQAEFSCETSCHVHCQNRCALDGTGLPGTTSNQTCRDEAGFRTCRGVCRRDANIERDRLDVGRSASAAEMEALQAIETRMATCEDGCLGQHCSPSL